MRHLAAASLFFLTILNAEQTSEVINTQDQAKKPVVKSASLKNVVKQYKHDSERQQMLRKAKYLKKKYETALSKLESWEMKKELLKKTFREKNRKQETAFGSGDAYGKERANKRRREYYNSLDVQERHIQDRVDSAHQKLTEIKEEFLFQYAVPLTDNEMNGVGVPKVENKSEKVQMLNEYINESSAWRKCRERVDEFDKVNQVAGSIEKLFPNYNLTQSTISKEMEQNRVDMQAHIDRFQSIENEYQEKYGLSIVSGERAQAILTNIENH